MHRSTCTCDMCMCMLHRAPVILSSTALAFLSCTTASFLLSTDPFSPTSLSDSDDSDIPQTYASAPIRKGFAKGRLHPSHHSVVRVSVRRRERRPWRRGLAPPARFALTASRVGRPSRASAQIGRSGRLALTLVHSVCRLHAERVGTGWAR